MIKLPEEKPLDQRMIELLGELHEIKKRVAQLESQVRGLEKEGRVTRRRLVRWARRSMRGGN